MKTERLVANDLTNEEKAKLLVGKNFWETEDFNGRLPTFVMSDGPVGLRHCKDPKFGDQTIAPSVAYPSFEVLSQTWEPSLAKDFGKAIANDCMDLDVDIILGPGCNIKRLPQNGRNFEYFSEDPLVAGEFAKNYIEGVQNENVGTCLKHFVANNTEISRNFKSMDVSERAMHEIYLKPFEIAVTAQPWEVMCSYNLLNGVRMSENKKMYSILRKDFGFKGLIVSDWGAVMDRKASLDAGLDLEMPCNEEHLQAILQNAKDGKLDQNDLDASTQRILDLIYKCVDTRELRKKTLSIEDRYAIGEKVEEEGIVLLKNENNALPLKEGEKVFVDGAAVNWYVFGGGSSEVTPLNPYVKLCDALKDNGLVVAKGNSVEFNKCSVTCLGNLKGAVQTMIKDAIDTSLVTITLDNHSTSESYNRQDLKISKEQVSMIHEFAKVSKKTIVVIYAGAPIEMDEWINEVDAILWVGYPGERGNNSIARVLTGKVNPSGKTTETFPHKLEDFDAVNAYEDAVSCIYQEDLNVGYRQFVSDGKEPLFPFGFGLSYSRFEYSNLKIEKDGEYVNVRFDIENTSDIDGKEVAQIYVEELMKDTYRPKYELKGFKKVFVKAHSKESVIIKLDRYAFEYYSTGLDAWAINHRSLFKIMVASSSRDIKLEETISY